MPVIFAAHGAPVLLDDAGWMAELASWADAMPKPKAFTHLGFPAYFRVELSWAKLLGVVLGGGHRRALGALVLLLEPPAGHADERLAAHRRLLKP